MTEATSIPEIEPAEAEPVAEAPVAKPAKAPKPKCDNHPDRNATLVTDGKSFQVLHLCEKCVPASWK